MLFNSYEFIFLFVPITLLGFVLLSRAVRRDVAMAWLVLASLFFYGWWNPIYLLLIIFSMGFNFGLGCYLGSKPPLQAKWTLALGVIVNLGLIGYFKYANFFVDTVTTVLNADFHIAPIVLPLAISFFTFQQIAFLVDAYRGETREFNFVDYALFVTFFPQLIAGPIVHHKEMLPQFKARKDDRLRSDQLAIGATIFIIGLFKKVVIADSVAQYATPVFSAAENGTTLGFFTAWAGVLCYAMQIYFDFSGYSDMAIGLGRLFGIKLPLNFNSPYKATNIVDFWRRWHITLSRFLRDYLYIALGGNQKGRVRRYVNLMVTMLLGGLWHGAGWTFVIWGGLHGFYLMVNHAWHAFAGDRTGFQLVPAPWIRLVVARGVTFLAVLLGWVYFRAGSLEAANDIVASMLGLNGTEWTIPRQLHVFQTKMEVGMAGLCCFGLLIACWTLPNTQEILGRFEPALNFDSRRAADGADRWWRRLQWSPSTGWAIVMALIAVVSLLFLSQVSEFIYYQF